MSNSSLTAELAFLAKKISELEAAKLQVTSRLKSAEILWIDTSKKLDLAEKRLEQKSGKLEFLLEKKEVVFDKLQSAIAENKRLKSGAPKLVKNEKGNHGLFSSIFEIFFNENGLETIETSSGRVKKNDPPPPPPSRIVMPLPEIPSETQTPIPFPQPHNSINSKHELVNNFCEDANNHVVVLENSANDSNTTAFPAVGSQSSSIHLNKNTDHLTFTKSIEPSQDDKMKDDHSKEDPFTNISESQVAQAQNFPEFFEGIEPKTSQELNELPNELSEGEVESDGEEKNLGADDLLAMIRNNLSIVPGQPKSKQTMPKF